MKPAKNIIYLYSEVMPYAISVMRALVQEFGVQVDCICWDNKKRTPYLPVNEPGIVFHKRSLFDKRSIIKFIQEREPELMYIVGRMDPLYLETVRHFKSKCCIVTGCDNQWEGTLKQRIGAVLSPILYKRYFEYFWVPGPRQYEFARRLGYPQNKITWNHLTADDAVFGKVYEENKRSKQVRYPHNIVFAGRFVKIKGIDTLIDAFRQAKNETNNDWRLTLIGSGDIQMVNLPDIDIKPFMSGQELAMASKEFGVFCLPSHREPWGVVIHEFTMAGLPIIASEKVGAADTLVINNYNGIIFDHLNIIALKNAIINMMFKSDEELLLMGERGHKLSKMHSPVLAAYSLMSTLHSRI